MVELPTVPEILRKEAEIPPHHIIVKFGGGIPAEAQGPALLVMERWLREYGVSAEVYKETMVDDLKSRRNMTEEQRANL